MNSEGNIIILNNNNDNDIGINNDELPEYVLSQELIGHNEMVIKKKTLNFIFNLSSSKINFKKNFTKNIIKNSSKKHSHK